MPPQPTSNRTAAHGLVGRVARAPFQPQTYRNLAYLLAMFPLGLCYFTVLTVGLFTGLPLVVVGVGVPIVLGCLVLAVVLATVERRLVRWSLGVDVPTPRGAVGGSLRDRLGRLVRARETWTAVAYLLAEFVYGTVVFGVLTGVAATATSFALAPFYYTAAPVTAYGPIPTTDVTLDVLFSWDSLLVGLTTTFELGSWRVETLPGALLVAVLGVVLFVVLLLFANAAARLWGRFARRMLTTPRYWT